MPMKKMPLPASAEAYLASMGDWQRAQVVALRAAVHEAAPGIEETLKWGHLVYAADGPVLLIRAEAQRVLFGFWRGQRLREIEPRLKPGGKYEMATLELGPQTPLARETVLELVRRAVALNASLGNPAVPRSTA
jgi:hypothetical protein